MKTLELSGEIVSVMFEKGSYRAVIELKQEYLDKGFRSLGNFVLAIDKSTALELTESKFLKVEVSIEGSEQESAA